jgi:hypothetical protein
MLYFIKGDSSKNWGAMKLKLAKGVLMTEVITSMEKNGWKCVTRAVFTEFRKSHRENS